MKVLKRYFFPMLLVLALTACGKEPNVPEGEAIDIKKGALKAENIEKPEDAKEEAEETETIGTENQSQQAQRGNSYWEAYQIEIGSEKQTLPSEEFSIDLILWEDGNARFREISDGKYLVDDRMLHMTWNITDEQGVDIYLEDYEEPWLSAMVDGDEMCMDYQGDIVHLKKSELPVEAGNLYHPAQLEGVWLLESSEVEGDFWEAQPGELESMIFEILWKDGKQQFVASQQRRTYWEEQWSSDYKETVTTILDEPLYSGCGNEEWSVLVGEYSELNENGYPVKTETYVTMLDENTMMRRLYYSFDGGPGVSHQIFKRITPTKSDVVFEPEDLEGGDYDVVSYIDKDGNRMAYPPGMKDFYVHLEKNATMVSWWDEGIDDQISFNGNWMMGDGGVINLVSYDYDGESEFTDTCWFAGSVHGVLSADPEMGEVEPEMYLYYDGGIIRLKHNSGSGGENFGGDEYGDSMNTLEGNAFAAPPEALFVLYGENAYTDYMDENFEFVSHYNLSSNAKYSRKILITAVLDNTLFWYEDENGNEVWSEHLDAGESVVLKVDVPQKAKELMCININDEAVYYYEISEDTIYPDDWYYITALE